MGVGKMSVIADLIRAGVDPDLVARVHEELMAARASVDELMNLRSTGDNTAERRRKADRDRKYVRRHSADIADIPQTSADIPPSNGSEVPPKEYISNPSPTSFPSPPVIPPLRSGITRAPAKTAAAILETCLSEKTAADVVAHRKALRKPLTPRAAELLAKQFVDFGDAERAAEAMISNAWQGFKPEWMADNRSRAGPAGRSNGVSGFLENVGKMMVAEREKDAERQRLSDGGHQQDVLSFPASKRE
jgi:hypothetical protein